MNEIIIKSQKALDNLPSEFKEFTYIKIKSDGLIVVRKKYDNATVRALDNATVKAFGNATVEAWGNATVEAWDNATVKAFGNATVRAFDNATVEAWYNATVKAFGNATVRAFDNATVEAWGNVTVEAWGNVTVEAFGNATVKAWGNVTVEAWGNVTVEALDNATVRALDNATVSLFLFSYALIFSNRAIVKKALDYSIVVFKGCEEDIKEKGKNVLSRVVSENCDVSFDEWIRRGFVVADGIHKSLKSSKKINNIDVYECDEFGQKKSSYLVRRDGVFSHGETIEKAIEDLRYKIADRDMSDYEHWKTDKKQIISIDEAIQGYRVITGACEFGVKEFVSRLGDLQEEISINEILEKTKNAYGNESLKDFLG